VVCRASVDADRHGLVAAHDHDASERTHASRRIDEALELGDDPSEAFDPSRAATTFQRTAEPGSTRTCNPGPAERAWQACSRERARLA